MNDTTSTVRCSDDGVDDTFMRDVGAQLAPGRAALFLLIDQVTPDKVAAELAKHNYGGQLPRTNLSAGAEQNLREVAEAARAAAR